MSLASSRFLFCGFEAKLKNCFHVLRFDYESVLVFRYDQRSISKLTVKTTSGVVIVNFDHIILIPVSKQHYKG